MSLTGVIKGFSQKWTTFFQKMYNWVLRCSEHPQAVWLLALAPFSRFLPMFY